uniref:Uncharacterized protein n=1 Tax=Fagus sylvatica TaxID=28930 RepID=A0A2N9FGW1_FAGSY
MVSEPPSCGPHWAISGIPPLLHVHGDSTTVRNCIAATTLLGIPHLRASIQVTTLPKHRSCPDLLVATRINQIRTPRDSTSSATHPIPHSTSFRRRVFMRTTCSSFLDRNMCHITGVPLFFKGRKFWRYVTKAIPKPVPKPPAKAIASNATPPVDVDFEIRLEEWKSIQCKILSWFINTFVPTINRLLPRLETTQAACRSPLPSLDATVKELISEENRHPHHHLPSSDVVLATLHPLESTSDLPRCRYNFLPPPLGKEDSLA